MIGRERFLIIETALQEIRVFYWESGLWGRPPKICYQCNHCQPQGHQDGSSLPGQSELTAALKNMPGPVAKKKLPVYLLIPFEMGLIREFMLPWIPKRERDAAVHYAIQHEVPGIADELFYAYQAVEEDGRGPLKIRVIAARRDLIQAYADWIHQAGYTVRGIEYSISAFGSILPTNYGREGSSKTLWIQKADSRIQMVLYKDNFPAGFREFKLGQGDYSKAYLYLGLNDEEFPVDRVGTDGSDQAEQIALALLKPGRAKKRLEIMNPQLSSFTEFTPAGSSAYALLGELQRVRRQKTINFFLSLERPKKMKLAAALLGVLLSIFLVAGSLIWYPRITESRQIQKQMDLLHQRITYLETVEEQSRWTEFKVNQAISSEDLERIQKFLEQNPGEITLTRLNLKQGIAQIWGESRDNASLSRMIGILTAEGWRDPVLVDYSYQSGKITFSLRMKKT